MNPIHFNTSLRALQVCDRPREKFFNKGVAALSDLELLALILGKGTSKSDVMALASSVLKVFEKVQGAPLLESLTEIDGIGPIKASGLLAAIEFSRRRLSSNGVAIRTSEQAYSLVRYLAAEKQEHFVCVSLNGESVPIAVRVVTVGLVNQTQVHPREVFAEPIVDRAAAVILAHNHPSGSLQPSSADIRMTRVLLDAGKLLGIPVLDHIIFSERGFYSFQMEGEL